MFNTIHIACCALVNVDTIGHLLVVEACLVGVVLVFQTNIVLKHFRIELFHVPSSYQCICLFIAYFPALTMTVEANFVCSLQKIEIQPGDALNCPSSNPRSPANLMALFLSIDQLMPK